MSHSSKPRNVALLGLALAGLFLTSNLTSPALGQPPEVLEETLTRFTTGLSQANASAVQAECTAALWGRLSPAFAGNPAAGDFGVFETIRAGLLKSDLAVGYVVCNQADGVRDVLTVTLVKNPAGAWQVSGGLGAMTEAQPLGS